MIKTYILQEDLKDTTSFLVNETRDTLHTTTTSETADSLEMVRRTGGKEIGSSATASTLEDGLNVPAW